MSYDEIEDALLFSQRSLVESLVRDWAVSNVKLTTLSPSNVIAALDSLGLLDRAKVREEFKKSRETTFRQEEHEPRQQSGMDGK